MGKVSFSEKVVAVQHKHELITRSYIQPGKWQVRVGVFEHVTIVADFNH